MVAAPLPENDTERLKALWAYELLDTQPEEAFDSITRLAANLCRVPIAVVTLVDRRRQWFKSQCGLGGVTSTGRDVAFCAHAILEPDILEIPDAKADLRFADNPLVTGEPHIRFYAGMPLIDAAGMALGTLCVINRVPQKLSAEQKQQLRQLAKAVTGLIEMRLRRSELDDYQRAVSRNDRAHTQLRERSEHLRSFARSARAHRSLAGVA